MPREAVILVRIDNMDSDRTEGQASIRIPLTEIGPETVPEWIASALREVPSELDGAGELDPAWRVEGDSDILGRLRSLGLIDYPQRGEVAATDILFLDTP